MLSEGGRSGNKTGSGGVMEEKTYKYKHIMEYNPQIELAERYVTETGVSLFLTGKAGTGKTTFLRHIVSHCSKRHVVVAPTGVAAVNAGGVTIHSFFQLPFCPYLPDVPELVTEYQMPEQQRKLRKNKIDILRTLDLLIIDEISMVRADLLDAVDATLRRYRRNGRPFGGVQLLMIGDVQQLAPVVTDEERPYMERVYPSPFFFNSKALQRLHYITIQLTTIYRQQDPLFVNLLNNIRDSHFDPETLQTLNSRLKGKNSDSKAGGAEPDDTEPILLTTHNYQADAVNQRHMKELKTPSYTFEAKVTGNFPPSSAPVESTLELKPGAQVMFVKNDSSGNHRYYNGKIGTLEEVRDEEADDNQTQQVIVVRDEEGERIEVSPETWENVKYEINPTDKEIKQIVDGTLTQYPLKLAWAITIHKAQGLTFDRVQVDAASAFAYGQVYVALSRCRSLEGLTLLSPITANNAFANNEVEQYNHALTPPDQARQQLDYYRTQYYYDMLFELFDFSRTEHDVESLERLFQEHLRSTYPQQAAQLTEAASVIAECITAVAERFKRQLTAIAQTETNGNKQYTEERIAKGSAYFLDQMEQMDKRVKPMLEVVVDNKETASRLKELAEQYRSGTELKIALLKMVKEEGFEMAKYQKAKVDFTLQPKNKRQESGKVESVYANNRHPEMIKRLSAWRRGKAEEANLPAFAIITQKSLLAIADNLPQNMAGLLRIPGIGKMKAKQFGQELLQIVHDYCADNNMTIEPKQNSVPEQEEEAKPTRNASRGADNWKTAVKLLAEGKSVEEIAQEMSRAKSTVEGYLISAVEKGALDPDLILPQEEQDEIITYMLEHRDNSLLKEVYEHFDGKYSYLKLRVARFISKDL